MNRNELIKVLLSKSSFTVKELSEKLNINRSNYYLWTSSRSTPKQSTINRLADLLNIKISWNNKNDGEIKQIKSMNPVTQNTKDLIHLQRMEIRRLKDENSRLKQNPVESMLFSEQDYDWSTTVDIKVTLKGIKRRISNIENMGSLSKSLKTSNQKLLPYLFLKCLRLMVPHGWR